jgi:Flp pilus assembly protein TadG
MANNRMRKLWMASLSKDTEGSVLIEATLLTPFLVMLIFGMLEFSWYFQKQQLVESGVRDAARYLARVAPENGTDPCGLTNPVNFAVNARNIAVNGATSGGTARVPGWVPANVVLTCSVIDNSATTYQGGQSIYIVTASTNFADPALGYFGLLGLTTPNLSASHSERSVGPG